MKSKLTIGSWVLAAAVVSSVALYSCKKPFEGVTAILSNSFVSHQVAVQIVDANAAATNPYPAAPVITLGGEAVTAGLVYTNNGEQLTAQPGSATVVRGSVGLAIRPYTVITPAQPLRFTINVQAEGYLPASKEVVVTSKDSLQYVDINMVRIASAPEGVSVKQQAVSGVTAGTIAQEALVAVTSPTNPEGVEVTLPAGTVFQDAQGNTINSTGSLAVTAAAFDNTNPEAVAAIPGGIANVKTADGSEKTFVLGGALDLNVTLGGTAVKNFSQPIQADVAIDGETFNPNTGRLVEAGDAIEVWSNSGAAWTREGVATVFSDNGVLKATMNITHLSTWMVAYGKDVCSTPLSITYESDAEGTMTHYMAVYAQGTNQFLADKKVSVQNGDVVSFSLPAGIAYDVKLYEGSSSATNLVETKAMDACASAGKVNYKKPANRPTLYFDLSTKCNNGMFRYTGPINYRVSGTKRWSAFTPAEDGELTTTLLEWNKSYDFQIVYKEQAWERSRTVLQAEFREDSDPATTNRWEFWGREQKQQKFFNAPTTCGN